MNIKKEDFDVLAVFATRYAIGRMSTAPGLVADIVTRHKDELSEQAKRNIVDEIESFENLQSLGMDQDIDTWQNLVKELEE